MTTCAQLRFVDTGFPGTICRIILNTGLKQDSIAC